MISKSLGFGLGAHHAIDVEGLCLQKEQNITPRLRSPDPLKRLKEAQAVMTTMGR